jgi:hypothetical protein
VPGGPIDFLAAIIDPPHTLVLQTQPTGRTMSRIGFTLAFEIRPATVGSRLITRVRARVDLPLGRLLERWFLGPGDGLMVRRQLLNLSQRVKAAG